jgi:hypothetical protein
LFLKLGSRERRVVSFTPHLLYTIQNSTMVLAEQKAGVPQSSSKFFEEKKSLTPARNQVMIFMLNL